MPRLSIFANWKTRSRRGKGRPGILRSPRACCWRCGSTQPVMGWEARGRWRGCARATMSYRWLVGGVSVNYHTLSDFRVNNGELLDRLLTENMATLAACGVVDL